MYNYCVIQKQVCFGRDKNYKSDKNFECQLLNLKTGKRIKEIQEPKEEKKSACFTQIKHNVSTWKNKFYHIQHI